MYEEESYVLGGEEREDEYLWLVPYWKAPCSANDILHQKQKKMWAEWFKGSLKCKIKGWLIGRKNIASDKTLSYIHQIDKVLLNSFAKEVSVALTKG